MKKVSLLLLLFVLSVSVSSRAIAQGDRTGITFGVQTGYEYVHYTEYLPDDEQDEIRDREYKGSSAAIVATASIELDLRPLYGVPVFLGISGGIPLHHFPGEDRATGIKDGVEYLTQTNAADHEYSMFRVLGGYKVASYFQPFLMFERALFQSTRWDLREGTDDGELLLDSPNVTWHERVWSSHIGGGFQGGILLDEEEKFSARFRVAMLLPIASFVTNDHPRVDLTDGSLGEGANGMSVLSRLALYYSVSPRSTIHVAANWYYRRWEETSTTRGSQTLTWPENVMNAVPVLVGFTWSI